MILAQFQKGPGGLYAFTISGHSGYAEAGSDIVCASVSSAVQLTANAVTEVVKARAQVKVKENTISLFLKEPGNQEAVHFLDALLLHLQLLEEDYQEFMKVTVSEV